ncbi:MAG: hypothetical protein ACRC62_15635 [Microcoleus sp.]
MRKLTHEFVKAQFALEGYELLSEYAGVHKPLKYLCPKGHEHQITWGNFQSGNRCGVCAGKHKSTKFIKKFFEKEGYVLLEEYKNCAIPIKFRCPKGHEHQMSWDSFRNGSRCGVCSGRYVSHEFVKAQFALEGYELLGKYKNCAIPIKFRCSKGHEHQMSWDSFRNGSRCRLCLPKDLNKTRLSEEFIKSQFALEGYELLSVYLNARTPVNLRCPKGHKCQIAWGNFKTGNRCSVCRISNFYTNFENRTSCKIFNSISRQLKRQKLDLKWDYFYSSELIKSIAEPIQPIYRSCPKGHAVDHIVPVSWFNLLNEDELLACWHPANLRHLDALENNKRKNRMTDEEIAYMRSHHPEIINAASRSKL